MFSFKKTAVAFLREEDGVALTEYLVLLGLLIGGVLVAVGAASTDLAGAWESWGNFWSSEVSNTPTTTTTE